MTNTIISGNVYPRPDWADAPSWAKYLAMDSDGCWAWYSAEPRSRDVVGENYWDGDGKREIAFCHGWETTLEPRPKRNK
jgi:hypothetical protein